MKENFSGEDSLHLIAKMITQAKSENRERGDGWLLWGWLLFSASISSFILLQFNMARLIHWIWNGMAILVYIYFVYSLFAKKTVVVKTYVQEMLKKFGTGFFLSLVTVITVNAISGNSTAFGYFFIIYAFWMYIYGSAIQFKPLIVGAFVNWAAAISMFIVHDFKYLMLISAGAIAFGYLIPGYMLRNQYKKSHTAEHGI